MGKITFGPKFKLRVTASEHAAPPALSDLYSSFPRAWQAKYSKVTRKEKVQVVDRVLANQTTLKLKIEIIITRGLSFHVSFARLYVYRFCSLSNIECLTMKTSHFLEQYSSWRREDWFAFFFQFPW